MELEEKLKRHQDEAAANMKQHQAEAVAELKSGQELVMTRKEEQRQAVSQALENQDQRSAIETSQKQIELQQAKDDVKEIVRGQLRELAAGERSLTAVAPAFLDRHSGMIAKPNPYDGKTSWDIYYLQFENIASMNNWSNKEKACVLTSMLIDSAAATLENLSSFDLRDYNKITSALKLRFENAHSTELLYG
nr:unnamed protein product [Callosobruchus chinensis]